MRWDPSHISPRVNHHGRECEPALFPYNKPVAWWGNLPVSQVTAAGRERDVLMLGRHLPQRVQTREEGWPGAETDS